MQSMTGFGKGEAVSGEWTASVDIRTVNHRFLDVSLRLPRNMGFLEPPLRQCLSEGFRRGHVDMTVTLTHTAGGQLQPAADLALAGAYSDIAQAIAQATGRPDDLTVSALMGLEGVLTCTEEALDQEAMIALSREACAAAMEATSAMRALEGEVLRRDLTAHLDALAALRQQMVDRAPQVTEAYREALKKRIEQLLEAPMDPIRLAQETAVFADKAAIDEELARLDSHIRQMRLYLDADREIGKKMDFLIQEMNREVNTIGSKANDAALAQLVVDAKSEIEKLREQVQNVE